MSDGCACCGAKTLCPQAKREAAPKANGPPVRAARRNAFETRSELVLRRFRRRGRRAGRRGRGGVSRRRGGRGSVSSRRNGVSRGRFSSGRFRRRGFRGRGLGGGRGLAARRNAK